MIKIIKNGVKPKPTRIIYKATCPHCGCIFEFEVSDLTIEKTLNGRRTITCPCCEMVLDIAYIENLSTREEEIIDE
ncbi:MAG: hypothetical protein J6Z11_12470 [Candidatus Riflebacteria bacterium]|nr:hypothetical protein [Candidatus Riflebacteria bacterium]